MTPYHAQHADLFRAVVEILARDYIAPSETAETVAEWCENYPHYLHQTDVSNRYEKTTLMEPSELAALISDVEGYERREG